MLIVEKRLLCNLNVNCRYCVSCGNRAFKGELYKLTGLALTLNFYVVRDYVRCLNVFEYLHKRLVSSFAYLFELYCCT